MDSFDFRDEVLDSSLGAFDGWVYHRLWVYKNRQCYQTYLIHPSFSRFQAAVASPLNQVISSVSIFSSDTDAIFWSKFLVMNVLLSRPVQRKKQLDTFKLLLTNTSCQNYRLIVLWVVQYNFRAGKSRHWLIVYFSRSIWDCTMFSMSPCLVWQ